LTEKITGAQNSNFAFKFTQNLFFLAANFAFLDKIFFDKKNIFYVPTGRNSK